MAAPLLVRLLPSRNPEHRRSVWGPRMPAKGSGRRPDAGVRKLIGYDDGDKGDDGDDVAVDAHGDHEWRRL